MESSCSKSCGAPKEDSDGRGAGKKERVQDDS